ncbi:hypothetical protein A0H81_02481 [Grifola frondosa]|uniref:Uncharacterized protein n=1 Tax=Grifola frondosa TaxID=5627 RepID=A0A1C7MN08_GRIFR|nr:hypothetical protein A0H81_02481 [Grifola frondosa]
MSPASTAHSVITSTRNSLERSHLIIDYSNCTSVPNCTRFELSVSTLTPNESPELKLSRFPETVFLSEYLSRTMLSVTVGWHIFEISAMKVWP